jgi:hypothetical protein
MKSSYQQEFEFLLCNPQRAKKNATRIQELRVILAEIDTEKLTKKSWIWNEGN